MCVPFYFWFPILVSGSMGFMALCIPPVSDQFMELFGVGYGGLSFFLSAYYWTHSFVQVPAGLIVDRIGVIRSFILCISVSLACALVPFFAPESLALAVAARLVLGVCTGAFFLITVKIVKAVTPPGQLSRVQGAQGAAFSLGSMVPYLTLPFFGAYGWIACYGICAGLCVWLAAGAFRLPLKTISQPRNGVTARQTWEACKIIATSRDVWFIGICHGLSFGSLTTVVGNWLPTILMDTRPGTTIESWALVTGVLLLAGTVGRVLGGEVARTRHRGKLIHRAVFAIAASYGIIAIAGGPAPVIAAALILALLGGGTYAAVYTLAIDRFDPAYVATSIGFLNMIANAINMLLILALGMIRDVTGSFSLGLCVIGFFAAVFAVSSRAMAEGIETRTA